MKRRNFLRSAAAVSLLTPTAFGKGQKIARPIKIIKPKRLRPGDTIAVIAPASGIEPENFEKALQNLADLGFKTKAGINARRRAGFLAGTDKERTDDLHRAFADKTVDGIWCVRGGYGATRILPAVDFNLIRRNPKIFVGYSDITALHTAIFQNTGLVTFHGPVAASSFSDYTKNHLVNVLMNPSASYKIESAPENAANESELYKTATITPGKCRGTLIGGNLSLLTAVAGTPFALRATRGKILFIEDVREAPYRVDRMLTQLRESLNLSALAGIALGVFADSNPKDEISPSLLDVVKDRLGDLGIPVVYGLSFGHIHDQFTLPVGIRAELDADAATINLLESGVI